MKYSCRRREYQDVWDAITAKLRKGVCTDEHMPAAENKEALKEVYEMGRKLCQRNM